MLQKQFCYDLSTYEYADRSKNAIIKNVFQ